VNIWKLRDSMDDDYAEFIIKGGDCNALLTYLRDIREEYDGGTLLKNIRALKKDNKGKEVNFYMVFTGNRIIL
jgi:hypothetical protein